MILDQFTTSPSSLTIKKSSLGCKASFSISNKCNQTKIIIENTIDFLVEEKKRLNEKKAEKNLRKMFGRKEYYVN